MVFVALGALAVAGCGGGDDPPAQAALAAACDAGNDGRHVIVEGYLRLPERLRISTTTVIDVFAAPGAGGARQRVEFPIGDQPNQLERPPATYAPTSLRVIAADGAEVTINDRVRLTAQVARDDTGCLMREPQVERVGPVSEVRTLARGQPSQGPDPAAAVARAPRPRESWEARIR